jgi:hypothetical protein
LTLRFAPLPPAHFFLVLLFLTPFFQTSLLLARL